MHILSYMGYTSEMPIAARLFNDNLNLQTLLYNLHYFEERFKALDKALKENRYTGCEHDIQLVEDLTDLTDVLLNSSRVTYETIKRKQINI